MCKCASKLNEKIKPMNYALSRNLFEGDAAPALIEIAKIDRKKRTASMSLVASYCPFCGKKYPKRKSRGILKSSPAQAVGLCETTG
jgi:hypothetical protein